jgi:hypothetical protein
MVELFCVLCCYIIWELLFPRCGSDCTDTLRKHYTYYDSTQQDENNKD